jgi:hypothetical protein
MECNNIFFPVPYFRLEEYTNNDSDVIFIPKPNEPNSYIPCLLFLHKLRNKDALTDQFLIYFHGNAEDIFACKWLGKRLNRLLELNVLIVEFPKYSIYIDEPDSNKFLSDSTIVFDYVVSKFKTLPNNIYIMGRSIGTVPAIYLASQRKAGCLISVSAFTSLRDVVGDWVGRIMKLIVFDKYRSIDYISGVTCAVLFIHGQKDALVSYEHSIRLKDKCCCPYEVHLPEDMTHSFNNFDNEVLTPIKMFLMKHTVYNKNNGVIPTIPNDLYNVPDKFLYRNLRTVFKGVSLFCFGAENT